MITIVTVCFNEKKDIVQTLESVLTQDYSDFEYIIKDGGSTDGTAALIDSYAGRFIQRGIKFRFISGRDSGLYDAMNTAARDAEGEWVNFMNGGDRFFDDHVLSSIFSGRDYTGTDLIYGDALEIEFGEYFYYRKCPELIESRMPFSHQTVFASRELLREYPFDTGLRIGADYNFLLKAYKAGKKFTDSGVLTAVVTKSGISTVRLRDTYLESIKIRRDNGIVQPSDDEIRRSLRYVNLKQFGMDHFPSFLKYLIRRVQRLVRHQKRVNPHDIAKA